MRMKKIFILLWILSVFLLTSGSIVSFQRTWNFGDQCLSSKKKDKALKEAAIIFSRQLFSLIVGHSRILLLLTLLTIQSQNVYKIELSEFGIEPNPGPVTRLVEGKDFISNVPLLQELTLIKSENFLSIEFPDDMIDLAESFTTTEPVHAMVLNSRIIHVPLEVLHKLPHNLCLSMFNTGYTEGTIDTQGLTPDFVKRTDEGLLVMDVKTRNTRSTQALRDACTSLVGYYSHLTDKSKVMCVAVGLERVQTENIELSDEMESSLVSMFKVGRRILEKFSEEVDFDSPGLGRIEVDNKLRTLIEPDLDMSGLDNRLKITKERMLDWKALDDKYSARDVINLANKSGILDEAYKTLPEYLSSLPGRKEPGSEKSFVHVPMVLPMLDSEGRPPRPFYEDIEVCEDVADLWKSSRPGLAREEPGFLFLRMFRSERLTEEEKALEGSDIQRYNVSSDFEDKLAQRGVDGKWVKKKKDLESHESNKQGFNGDYDTSSLDLWKQSEILPYENKFPLSEADFMKSNDENVVPQYKMMWESDLISSCVFLDLMVRELLYNQPKNIKGKTLGSKRFRIRKIPHYNAYLLIKPTSMTGDKPIFFSLLFNGNKLENFGIFEKTTHLIDNWHYTEFISMDSDRLSNLLNIQCQVVNLWALCVEKLTSIKFTSRTKRSTIFSSPVTRALKFLTVLLIEDKEDVSTCNQLLRYYYMKVCTGGNFLMMEPERITNKLPEVIRSPVILHVIQRLKVDKVNLVGEAEDEGDDEFAVKENFKFYSCDTPFGFRLNHPDDIVLVSYACMLHNKDEGDNNSGSIQCVNKMLKMELKLVRKLEDESYDPQNDSPNGFYSFSPSAVVAGAKMVLSKMVENNDAETVEGDLPKVSLDCLSELSGSTISELASTKSSTVSIMEDDIDEMDIKDLKKKIPNRSKCAIEMWKELGDTFTNLKIIDNISNLFSKLSEHPFVLVSLFKKNQIGGVREISILKFTARCLISVLERLMRGLCGMQEEECLTKPKEKNLFLSNHSIKVSKQRPKGTFPVTIKMSSDMTTWCQCFLMMMFAVMCSVLLPIHYWALVIPCLNLMQRKRVELPLVIIRKFMETDKVMEDEKLEYLRMCFLGKISSKIMSKGKAYINLAGNMLQGILHYTSSMYHVCHLTYFSNKLTEHFNSRGISSVISFQTSSDDEGVLITLFFSAEDIEFAKRRISYYVNYSIRMKIGVDLLFGLKTSWEKTTISILPVYEFNSVFFFGNSIICPLIKQVARVCDDPVEDSLHKRVCNLISSLSSLRDEGASGSLCQACAISQTISLQRNLGRGTMTWWDEDCEKFYRKIPLSINGHLPVPPMISAGFLDVQFLNYQAIPTGKTKISTLIHLFQLYTDVTDGVEDTYQTKFSAWNSRRHEACLERLGLERSDMDQETFRVLLRSPCNTDEFKLHLEYMLKSKSVARSFARLKRSDMARVAVYYFWKPNVGKRDDFKKCHLSELLAVLDPSDCARDQFINSGYFDILMSEHLKTPRYVREEAPPLRKTTIFSYKPSQEEFLHCKTTMSNMWFDERRKMSKTEVSIKYSRLSQQIPWLRSGNLEEILSQQMMGGSYNALLEAINSLTVFKTSHSVFLRKSLSRRRFYDDPAKRNTMTCYTRHSTPNSSLSDNTGRVHMFNLMRVFYKIVGLCKYMSIPEEYQFMNNILREEFFACLGNTESKDPQWDISDNKLNVMLTYKKIIGLKDFDPNLVCSMLEKNGGTLWTKTGTSIAGAFRGEAECYSYSVQNGWVYRQFSNDFEKIVVVQRGKYQKRAGTVLTDPNLKEKFISVIIDTLPFLEADRSGIRLCFKKEVKNCKTGHIKSVTYRGPRVPLEDASVNYELCTTNTEPISNWLLNKKITKSDLFSDNTFSGILRKAFNDKVRKSFSNKKEEAEEEDVDFGKSYVYEPRDMTGIDINYLDDSSDDEENDEDENVFDFDIRNLELCAFHEDFDSNKKDSTVVNDVFEMGLDQRFSVLYEEVIRSKSFVSEYKDKFPSNEADLLQKRHEQIVKEWFDRMFG
jgi:hypothetical protein